jgi:hypothetical protein
LTWIKTGEAVSAMLADAMSRRLAFIALGLIAVSALLFQPICEAAELHLAHAYSASQATPMGGDEGDSCCSMVAPSALRTAAPLAGASSIPVAAPAVGSPMFRPHVVIYHALPAAPPPLVPSYYIRSARIQR